MIEGRFSSGPQHRRERHQRSHIAPETLLRFCLSTRFRNSTPSRILKRNTAGGPGSVINVGVKSGTNSLHGTAYAFGRDASATDAANYFSTPGVPGVTPATLEQFGATAGGPIIKNKLFFFVGYEGLRVDLGDVAVDSIPTAVAGLGVKESLVDACNALTSHGANPGTLAS